MNPTSHRDQGTHKPRQEYQAGQTPAQTGAGPSAQVGESSACGVAGAVMGKAQDVASSVASRAEEAWESTKQGAQQVASAVGSKAEDAWEEVTRFVRRHPLATCAAGGGLAFLLIRAMERSSRLDFRGNRWRGFNGGRVPYGAWDRHESRTGERSTSGGMGRMAERAQDLASSVAERAGEAWESTRQEAQQMASAMANRAEEAWDTMRDWGKSYPLGTLLCGAALGFGLAQLLGQPGLFRSRQSSAHRSPSDTGSSYRPSGGRF